jgi:hypothetical protein
MTMLRALSLLVVVATAGCMRPAEGLVRDRAAADFACADYALHVEEVGPDVYRASGCGRELIYTCLAQRPPRARPAPPGDDDFADTSTPARVDCHAKIP